MNFTDRQTDRIRAFFVEPLSGNEARFAREPDKIVLLEWEQQTEEVGTGKLVKFKASKQGLFDGSTSLAAALWCVAVNWSRKSTQKQPGGLTLCCTCTRPSCS